ncbi:MAG: serine/threonine protein kinase [Acidimicrobiales bacterium]
MPADLVGARYQLHRELARTPSVAVFEAEDRRAGTTTGIAVALAGIEEPGEGRQLLGRRMARTVHPHVVSMYDQGKDGNRGFVAFRRPPRTLASELATAPYPPNRVAQMGLDLSSALATLHRAGLRLGTLNPGHVGIEADGAVRLSPWPLADPPGGWGGQGAWSAPEIVAGASPSMAGDVWSLGAVLLSSLVGTGPGQLSVAATEELADRLRQDASPGLVDAIGRSMVTDPSRRFATALGMSAALQGETVSRRQFVAAGIPRLTAGTRRLALASAAVLGVVSATTVGVGLSSLGGPGAAEGGGVNPTAAATPPPAAVAHRPGPAPSASGPNGVVAMSATPPSATATTSAAVKVPTTPGTSTTGSVSSSPVTEAGAGSMPATATTTPAPATPGAPTGSGDPKGSSSSGHGATDPMPSGIGNGSGANSGSGPFGMRRSAGFQMTAMPDHGGEGGPGD